MKADSNAAKKLTSLLRKLKSDYQVDPPPASEPVTQLVVGFLQWQATSAQAEQAFTRLMAQLVDINELRVSHDHELVNIIDQDYPLAGARIARMREALNEIYVREHAVATHSIASGGKKEQRAYLDSLPGMTPYVAAIVTLVSFGGHAMPVDEKLVELLAEQGIAKADAPCGEVESFLLRHIKATDALESHLLLQAWADDQNAPGKRKSRAAASKKTGRAGKSASSRKKRTTATRARKK